MRLAAGVSSQQVVYRVKESVIAEPNDQITGPKTVLYGSICAPQTTITLGAGVKMEGALYGKSIKLGPKVRFTSAPAPLP